MAVGGQFMVWKSEAERSARLDEGRIGALISSQARSGEGA